MKILIVHNFYQQMGGEEIVIDEEKKLLEDHGHQVILYTRDSSEINNFTFNQRLRLLFDSHWSNKSYSDLVALINKEKPDIAHFHNIFPLISPSGYQACNDAKIPVVQTLHNFRIICPSGFLLRDGKICELCIGKNFPYPAIQYGCYRNSRTQSLVLSSILSYHRTANTWEKRINAYIGLTNFSKEKMIQGGIPESKIFIKPNFVSISGNIAEVNKKDYCVYVGRLSDEKGVLQLVESWIKTQQIDLHIVGDGHLKEKINRIIESSKSENIKLTGWLSYTEVLRHISSSKFLIFPTKWYETFGRVIIEAYSCGVPVVASRIGAVEELVVDGETGLLFDPYDIEDMKEKITWMNSHPGEIRRMGGNARKEYERLYTPEKNYQILMDIYDIAMKNV